ncbi:hypothetical protein V8B97DRAFT_2003666 [Scleroderma yunnanense]
MPKRARQDKLADRKVTDFFARLPSTSASPAKKPSTSPTMPPKSRQVASSSLPVTRGSTRTARNHTPEDHTPSSAITTRSAKNPALSSDSRLNVASPPANTPVLRKSSNKRARMQKTPTQQVSQDLRMDNSPGPSPGSSSQVVDSSQFEEEELVLPTRKRRDFVKRHASKRMRVTPVSPEFHQSMDVETPDPFPGTPAVPATIPSLHPDVRSIPPSSNKLSPKTPIHPSAWFPSPPDTSEASSVLLPPTPEALNAETKTAKLIADIKAKAFSSANLSSDEGEPLRYRELDVSEDDDLEMPPIIQGKGPLHSGPKKENDIFSSPLTSIPPSSMERPFYKLRSCRVTDRASPSPLRRTSGRLRKAALPFQSPAEIAQKVSLANASSSTGKKAVNPLHALLREKRAADKKGTSSAALRLAENTVRQGSQKTLTDPIHDESDPLDLTDEQAAWRAIDQFRASSPRADHIDTEDYVFVLQQTRMLGSEAGAVINKILADDRVDKRKNTAHIARQKKALGVPLWKTELDDMDVDSGPTFPEAPFGRGSIILDVINKSHRTRDYAQLALLLESGAVISLPPQQLTPLVSSLFVIGFFSSSRVADASHNALRDLCTTGMSKMVLPFSVICTAFVQLGARLSVLDQAGWRIEGHSRDMHLSPGNRSEVLLRLVAGIKLTANSAALATDEVANHVLSLILVGLDATTGHVLHAELISAIDAICTHNATDLATRASIHKSVLSFASKLNPVNKARLVTFFNSGGTQTRHIAQWLAYCLLISPSVSFTDQLPPLDPLILLLSPPADSGQLFDVTREDTDYEDLGHNVSILGVALANIAPYIKDEPSLARRSSTTSIDGTPGKVKSNTPPLERLHLALEVLHGKIGEDSTLIKRPPLLTIGPTVDTRAARLDRSRVKAALQRLTMRLIYEHHALKGAPQRGRISTLQAWFSPRH